MYALDVPESATQTRLITLFCCPCSEVQQWRELRNSGIWPGLMCCTASAADKAAMEPSAVRQRYGVGIEAKPSGGAVARQAAAYAEKLRGPNVGWSMN